jgi:hypothetical protein
MANSKYTKAELKNMMWGVIDKEVDEARVGNNHFSKRFVLDMLLKEHEFKEGDTFLFTAPHAAKGDTWTFRVQKGEKPFNYGYDQHDRFRVWATSESHGTTGGGVYDNLEEFFLDLLNNFNRNVAIKNRYSDLRDWLIA